MARASRKLIESKLALAIRLSQSPDGPYPTPGALSLDHTDSGYAVGLIVNDGGGVADLSYRRSPAELVAWLDGFNAAFDLARKREHYGV